jgi:hypothetical protein
MAEFYFLISGNAYESDFYGAGDSPSKFHHGVHDISITVGPDELSKLLLDSTKGALLAEQEPWKNGNYVLYVMIFSM